MSNSAVKNISRENRPDMNNLAEAFIFVIPAAIVMLISGVFSAIFSSSETSFFSLTRDELKAFQRGTRSQQLVAQLMKNPDRILTSVLFWNLVFNLMYFSANVVMTRHLLSNGFAFAGGIASIGGLLCMIIFTDVLPKCIAVIFRRHVAALTSPILALAVRMVKGFIPYFDKLCHALRLAFWPKLDVEPLLDIDDLERAIKVSSSSKSIAALEKQVLQNILELMDVSVEEVMRPRGTYFTASAPISREDLHGRLPPDGYVLVVEPGSDNVTGAIPLGSYTHVPKLHLEYTAEKVIHVPWCAKLSFVLTELRARLRSVASIVNEYGDTIGIVTYEDIIDSVIEIDPSRTRRVLQRDPVVRLSNGEYSVEGMTTIRYLSRALKIEYDPPEGGLVTVAGLLHEELEKIPSVGDVCEWQSFRLEVTQVTGRGRLKVRFTPLENEAIEEINKPATSSSSSGVKPRAAKES